MQTSIITTPYWWDAAPPVDAPPAEWQNRVDVVIIGGGFTGFGAAIPLARAGLRVLIVEKDKIGAGASTRNGGITSGNLRYSFNQLSKGQKKPQSFIWRRMLPGKICSVLSPKNILIVIFNVVVVL